MDPAGPFAHHLRVPACQPWPAKLNPHLPPATEVAIKSRVRFRIGADPVVSRSSRLLGPRGEEDEHMQQRVILSDFVSDVRILSSK